MGQPGARGLPASGEPDAASSSAGQLSKIRYFQGRCAENPRALRGAARPDALAGWRAAAALALIESGRADEARLLALAADFQGTVLDETWFLAMYMWAEVCSACASSIAWEEVYELLAPSRPTRGRRYHCVRLIDWALGILALTLERGRRDGRLRRR